MDRKIRYVRKLSGTEANERFIMVMKDSLKLFPKPGVHFKVKFGEKEFETMVKIVDCWCQGPKKPHVHYRIDYSPIVQVFRPHYGQTITLEKVDESVYQLVD